MLGRWGGRRGAEGESTWGIVLLAHEPAALVLANLAWHLSLGAREVHLFLDDPADPVAEPAARLPGVTVIRCDRGFWAAQPLGRRPGVVVSRQTLCATLAYGRSRVDWLLHLDADEFLLPLDPMDRILARHRDHHGTLIVPVRERVYQRPDPATLFDGLFRAPRHGAQPHPLLEPLGDLARAGVLGHAAGKALTRTGLAVDLQPHRPRAHGPDPSLGVPRRPLRSAVLLHFDGLTPLHWLAKMLRRLPRPPTGLGPHRRAQLAALAACAGDPARLRALHDRLRVLPDPAPFLAAGLVEAHSFDPVPACRQVLGMVPDLSVKGFDTALRAADGELLTGL